MIKSIKSIKSKIYKKLNWCEHVYHTHPSYKSTIHYGNIGEVLAFDKYRICCKCDQVILIRMPTRNYSSNTTTIIEKGSKK